MDVDSPTPEFWQGAAIGVAAFALVVAAYPEIPLLSLTTGSLLAVVAVYLGTVALQSSSGSEEDGLESTEAERILASRLSEVDPGGLDAITEQHDGARQAVGDLIELWAEGEDLREFGVEDAPAVKKIAREDGIDAAIDEILDPRRDQ